MVAVNRTRLGNRFAHKAHLNFPRDQAYESPPSPSKMSGGEYSFLFLLSCAITQADAQSEGGAEHTAKGRSFRRAGGTSSNSEFGNNCGTCLPSDNFIGD